MNKTLLNGKWTFKILGKDSALTGDAGIEADVPGSVYSNLLAHGLIEDPYYRDNELKALKLMDNDFEFSKEFVLDKEQLKGAELMLRFDGIDTVADIYVNETLLGHTENMHRFYEFDLFAYYDDRYADGKVNGVYHKGCVREGKNTLRVVIYSPTEFIKKEQAKTFTGGSAEAMEGFPHIRKAHCMFGWDWGPRLPDAGIFRDVSIVEPGSARINTVYVLQEHIRRGDKVARVRLDFDIDAQFFGAAAGRRATDRKNDIDVIIKAVSPDKKVFEIKESFVRNKRYSFMIDEPLLWWPNGYGEQNLYEITVSLANAEKDSTSENAENRKEKLLDTWSRRIGLRTLTVNTEKDEYGECFAHEINGVKIFAMGADYIPEDNLLSRITPERTRQLLSDAVWANHNCIRVWGGGYYPDDYFYDICDELGLLLWQDFMFACASYELTEDFEKNVKEEIRQNIIRLRHHACLAIWCGNNELETQVLDGVWQTTLKQRADYTKLFEYIIPGLVREYDPQTFYWPSSPSSGGCWDNPWDEKRGDVHYWDVWHGEKPFTDYRKYNFRYLSEFGFQSFPELGTIESFTRPEDRNIFSYVMEMHQRNRAANGKILKYISATYLYPKSFEMLLYASQLLQADAIRYGVEHFRRQRGECMGAVVWQLNDIWPVASWASIDYFGRYKALHYAEKRMFAPVMISCREIGELSERPYCILEPQPINVGARLHVANETFDTVIGKVRWMLCEPNSDILEEGCEDVTVEPLSGVWLSHMDFGAYDIHRINLFYSFETKDGVVSQGSVLFTPPKHYEFEDPKLSLIYDRDKGEITVKSNAYAKSVCIEGSDGDIYLSDNFFDMEKGSRTVKIERGSTTEFAVKSVYDIA